MYYASSEETVLVGITEQSERVTVPAYYEGKPITIAPYAFAEARGIEHITISEGITEISEYCFYRTSITQIDLPTTLKSIEKYALICKISSITLPDGIKSIEKGVFEGCSQLADLTLPETVEYFDFSAIEDTAVTSLYIPRSVTQLILELEYNPFEKISEITVHPDNQFYSATDGVLFNKDGTELVWYPVAKSDTEYTVPNTVRKIGDYAFAFNFALTVVNVGENTETLGEKSFYGCSVIESVTIPKSLTSLGSNAFTYCKNLTSFNANPDNPVFSSLDGVLFNKEITELILYPAQRIATKYTVPPTVTSIRPSAFSDVKVLKNVVLPDGLTHIGDHAFYGCGESTLTVTFPESLEYIGAGAFFGCDLILTWKYSGDWTATDNKNNTVTLDETLFEDVREIKYKYLQDSHNHTLEKVKNAP